MTLRSAVLQPFMEHNGGVRLYKQKKKGGVVSRDGKTRAQTVQAV